MSYQIIDFSKKKKPTLRNTDQTQKHQPKKIAKDQDCGTVDMSELEDLPKKKKQVRNADPTQKIPTKEVTDNDKSDTACAISESEEHQEKSFAIQE